MLGRLRHPLVAVVLTFALTVPWIGTFLSYGGSALLANTAMLAIVLNLHMRRDDFSIYGY